MRVVFEELNGDTAVFVPDEETKLYHLKKNKLPKDSAVGDVFEAEIKNNGNLKLLKKLPEERKKREQSAEEKRAELLKRKKQSK